MFKGFNYKVLVGGLTAAFAMWVGTQPTLFPHHPYMRQIAIFIAGGGLLLLLGLKREGDNKKKEDEENGE